MKFFGFRGGVHPPENKVQTEHLATEVFPAPKKVYISMMQHIGAPVEPIVAVGDKVLKGQKIGDAKAGLNAPVHSSVSGTVVAIEEHDFFFGGKMKSVVIENDFQDTWAELTKIEDWQNADTKDLIAMIREKGIVGMGGATFPTHVKLNPPAGTKLDALVLNGAECEPYLNSDNRAMLEHPETIIEGIKILKKILNVSDAYVGIEDNKQEAIASMTKAAEGTGIEIVPLKTKYPQGGEKQLIKSILNRVVPSGQLPSSVGVVVQNTGTAAAVYDAIVNGKPLIERIATITGNAVKNPKNLYVRVGTEFSELLDYCGVERDKIAKLVMGGPMMGLPQANDKASVVKGTSGILALTMEETNYYEPRNCIRCSKCVGVCPMRLEPLMYDRLSIANEWDEMVSSYHLMDCIECGSCAYICPANRPLTQAIKEGKAKFRAKKK